MAIMSTLNALDARFLKGLDPQARAVVISAGRYRRLPAAAILYRQGEQAETLFLLVEGCARFFFLTENGRKILLQWLPPGATLGMAAFLAEPMRYVAGAEIVENSSVLAWDRKTVRQLAGCYPGLLDNTLSGTGEVLSWCITHHVSSVSGTASERLAHVLISLAAGIGEQSIQGTRLKITNDELANAANITTYTTSRQMSRWQKDGAIDKGRGTILLRDPQRLYANDF